MQNTRGAKQGKEGGVRAGSDQTRGGGDAPVGPEPFCTAAVVPVDSCKIVNS